MRKRSRNIDLIFLALIVLIIVGIPLGIRAYDNHVRKEETPAGAKEFTLTGHARKGWLKGDVEAYQAISLWRNAKPEKPVLVVNKGDLVVLRLKSSDVTHGFSLKDFNVFVNDGIEPGKVKIVSFKADKEGVFTFSCNAICGDNHQNMKGTLIVKGPRLALDKQSAKQGVRPGPGGSRG
jgi:heme/copper-type cytochrome/quinol oxidase subunit 2